MKRIFIKIHPAATGISWFTTSADTGCFRKITAMAMSLWALAAKSTFSLDLESANSSLGSARALACSFRRLAEILPLFNERKSLARRQRQHARRVRSPEKTRVIARTSFGESGHVQTHRKFWPRLRRGMKWEFTQAQYSRGRSVTLATSKLTHRGISRCGSRNFHRAVCHLPQKFWRHVQN